MSEWTKAPESSGLPVTLHQSPLVKTKISFFFFLSQRSAIFFCQCSQETQGYVLMKRKQKPTPFIPVQTSEGAAVGVRESTCVLLISFGKCGKIIVDYTSVMHGTP